MERLVGFHRAQRGELHCALAVPDMLVDVAGKKEEEIKRGGGDHSSRGPAGHNEGKGVKRPRYVAEVFDLDRHEEEHDEFEVRELVVGGD